MWWKISLAITIAFLAGCSKDDDNATGPEVQSQPSSTAADHPTTQQLLTGPRTTLEVKFAPITLQVPPGWEVKSYSDGTLVTIEGQTPSDVVGISVPVYHAITNDQEKSLENRAKQDFADHPDLLQQVGIRDLSGGKLIERLIVDPPLAPTQAAATGLPTTEPVQTLQWTFSLCVPASDGKSFNVYDLRFLGMTLKQYKTDQKFLRSVIDTLAYVPSDLFPK
jgi:hypothetical protein